MAFVGVTLSGTGTGSVSSAPAGIICPGSCSFYFTDNLPGPWNVQLTAIPDPGSVFVSWDVTAGAVNPPNSVLNPENFQYSNPDVEYNIVAIFDLAPPVCYELTPCPTNIEQLPIIVTNDLSAYVGQVIGILGQCFTVALAVSCNGSITLNNPIITAFVDCCSCNPPKVYELIDCTLENPSITTTTDLSTYVGQTIKVCEFISSPVIQIDGATVICAGADEKGFITQVTGPNSGFYYESSSALIKPYTNPLLVALVDGDQICVNSLSPFDVVSTAGNVWMIQFFLGTTALTNPILVNDLMPISTLQDFIDAEILNANTTIIVNTFDAFNKLNVTVTITDPVDETELTVLVTPPVTVPPAYPPTSTVVESITGECICYTVSDIGTSCTPFPAFTKVISGAFDDCECCDPPPSPEPVPYIPTPPEIDKHTYKVTESQCDIDANKTFANAMYDIFKTDAYGLESCCPRNFNQIWIQKELSDLSKINC